jgi:hypothetical protein
MSAVAHGIRRPVKFGNNSSQKHPWKNCERDKTRLLPNLHKESPMQSDPHRQEQTIARFILASRQHLGLTQATGVSHPTQRTRHSSSKLLHALLIASSLGALGGAPALASEASPDQTKTVLARPLPGPKPTSRYPRHPAFRPTVAIADRHIANPRHRRSP